MGLSLGWTHVHVQNLPIPSVAADGRGDDDQLVRGDEVPDAAFFARALVAGMGLDVELQRRDQGQSEG